jgi:Protein of unknown function (DUF4038)/Putative collagen-binding domain of a collagenase
MRDGRRHWCQGSKPSRSVDRGAASNCTWTRRKFLCGVAGAGLAGLSTRPPAAAEPASSVLQATGTTQSLLPRAAFPLQIETGKRFLTDREGRPFLLHGDTAWSLIADLNREDTNLYLEDRRRRGFNAILVNLIEHHFASNAPRNAYGAEPFSSSGDFSHPNEAYFAHADWVLERAAELGMLVLLAPAYLGFDGAREGWYQVMRANGPDKMRQYGRFLANRYARFRNIAWIHGGDFNPPDRTLTRAVAEGIREVDPSVLHTAHCGPETMASDYWSDEPWLDFNTLYTYGPVHLQAEKAARQRSGRPFILLESAYENEHGADAHRIRMQAYQALLYGACGHFFGNNPIWHFDGPGVYPAPHKWGDALDSPGSQSMMQLASVFSGIKWWTLEPDLKNRFLIIGGTGDHGKTVAAYANDRSLAVVYTPDSGGLKINKALFGGLPLVANWYDLTTGRLHHHASPNLTRSQVGVVKPPVRSRADKTDWLFVVRSTP